MGTRMLHIYRNTPFGRETLLQSVYFSKLTGVDLTVFIPRMKKLLMYFQYEAVQIDLDDSYLTDPDSAQNHVGAIVSSEGHKAQIIEATRFSASNLPDLPADFEFMTCPRVISDLSSKIALGRIGSKVRAILRQAPFPVLIPSPVYKPWTSIAVMFGGSVNAIKSLLLGLMISRNSGLPLDVYTQADSRARDEYERTLAENGLTEAMERRVRSWRIFESGKLEHNIFEVPHDSLLVLGAYGHGLIKDVIFGSTMELIQSTLPNNMLIVGPNFVQHPWHTSELDRWDSPEA